MDNETWLEIKTLVLLAIIFSIIFGVVYKLANFHVSVLVALGFVCSCIIMASSEKEN